jgi:cold shock CspA family protein
MAEGRREQRVRDETLICDRCGVTFLWLAEEQRQQGHKQAPGCCPGCRSLIPAPGRERGLVKWYNPRKRYGFIIRQKAADIFTHRAELQDINRLQAGDLIEFSIVSGDKGLLATNVHLLHREAEERAQDGESSE